MRLAQEPRRGYADAADPHVSGCCLEPGCKRRHPIGLYAGDFSGQVFAVTRRRVVKENDDGTAVYAATERHDVTEQMRKFIRRTRHGSACSSNP